MRGPKSVRLRRLVVVAAVTVVGLSPTVGVVESSFAVPVQGTGLVGDERGPAADEGSAKPTDLPSSPASAPKEQKRDTVLPAKGSRKAANELAASIKRARLSAGSDSGPKRSSQSLSALRAPGSCPYGNPVSANAYFFQGGPSDWFGAGGEIDFGPAGGSGSWYIWTLFKRDDGTVTEALGSDGMLVGPSGKMTWPYVRHDLPYYHGYGQPIGLAIVEGNYTPYARSPYLGPTDPSRCQFYFGAPRAGIAAPYDEPAGPLGNPKLSLTASNLFGLRNEFGDYDSCVCGDPVDNATGNFSETITDLSTSESGTGGVAIVARRTYNSMDYTSGRFGKGWTDEYAWSVSKDTATGVATVTAGNGSRLNFTPAAGGTYTAPSWSLMKLIDLPGGGFKLTKQPRQVMTFDGQGRLTSISKIAGLTTTVSYTGGNLTSVTDPSGRSLTYQYNASNLVSSVNGPGSRSVQYGYTNGNLTSVTDPAGKVTTMTYAPDGSSWTRTDPEGGVTRNDYDSQGRVSSQTDALGKVIRWDYADDGTDQQSSTTFTDAEGNQSLFKFRANVLTSATTGFGTSEQSTTRYIYASSFLQPTDVIDGNGNTTTTAYTATGQVAKVINARGQSTTYTYNANGERTSVKTPMLATTTFAYNNDGLLTTLTDPAGKQTGYTYTAKGEIDTVTTPEGRVTDYGYDSVGNRVSALSPKGNLTTATFNASGWVTSTTSPRGNVAGATAETYTTHTDYDPNGRVTQLIDPSDTVTTNIWNGNGKQVRRKVTNSAGVVVADTTTILDKLSRPLTQSEFNRTVLTNTFDDVGNVLSSSDGTGAKTSFSYDSQNRRATMTTARGNESGANAANFTWQYEYDRNGNATKTTDPQGRVTQTGYNSLNQPVSETTPSGQVTTTSYDNDARVSAVMDPLNNTTTYTYDTNGRLKGVALPGESPLLRGYDFDGNLTSETSPSGTSRTTWTYDADGQPATQVDPRGNVAGASASSFTTSWAYDPDGQVLQETNQLGKKTIWTYDPSGRRLTEKDALNRVTAWEYDALDRVTKVTPPSVGTGANAAGTSYSYDDYGDLTTRTDALGRSTQYKYNKRHQVVEIIDPLTRKRTMTYDPEGRLASWTTARGYTSGDLAAWTVNQAYDARGLLTARTANNSAASSTFGYNDDGDMTSMVDTTGTTAFGYDNRGQLTSVTHPQGNYSYSYTPAGRVASRTLPQAGAVEYGYNADGLNDTVKADGVTTTLTYDENQHLTRVAVPTATPQLEVWDHDRTGAIASVTNTLGTATLSRHVYTRDAVGNPTLVERTQGSTTANEAYTYDARNRLTKFCPNSASCASATQSITYAYDAVGNRTSQSRVGVFNPVRTTYSYDAADQLIAESIPSVRTPYTHNADGQLTSGGRTWNVLGQMTGSALGGTSATYTYDGQGNRRTVTTGAGTKKLSWDTNNPLAMLSVITSTDGKNTVQRYGPSDQLLSSNQITGAVSYYGHDDLGSITDNVQNGQAAINYSYEPFGAIAAKNTLTAGAVDPGFGFTGGYLEPAQGEYHLRARDYNTSSGRFGSTDPIEVAVGDPFVSAYSYVTNRPTVLVDPSGMCGFKNWVEEGWSTLTKGWRGEKPCQAEDWEIAQSAGVSSGLNLSIAGLLAGQDDMIEGAAQGVVDGLSFGLAPDHSDPNNQYEQGFRDFGQAFVIAQSICSGISSGGIATGLTVRSGVGAGAGSAAKKADIDSARFAQKGFGEMFDSGGTFAGQSINDVAGSLKSGALSPKDVPIDVIVRNGNSLILNTRSSQALIRAGIPRSSWNVIDRTGQAAYEARLSGQLSRNGLTSRGTQLP